MLSNSSDTRGLESNYSEWDITNALGASGEVRRLLDLEKVCLSSSETPNHASQLELEPFIQEQDL